MAFKLKELAKEANLPVVIDKPKVSRFLKKFLGLTYKKKVKVPLKKTTKSHHRLRTTWIL